MGIVGMLVMILFMVTPLMPPIIGAVVGSIYDRVQATKNMKLSTAPQVREQAATA